MINKLSYLFLFIGLNGIFLNAQVFAQPELDTTFGGSGGFNLNNSGLMEDLAIQPDGKILTLGACRNINAPFHHTFCITRINEDGSIDNTFGGGLHTGSVITMVPGLSFNNYDPSTGIAVQNGDKILAVGFGTIQSQKHPIYVRYLPNGDLDQEFGNGGIIISTIVGRAMELVVLPDDKFLVIGIDESSGTKHFVARYSSDGTLDTSFGNNGIATLDLEGTSSLGFSIALQPDGKILTGGFITTGLGTSDAISSYLLTRLNQDGSLDTTFDDDGYQTADYSPPSIIVRSQGFITIAPQIDGRILALGTSNILYRFNSDGSLDTSFGDNGSRQALNASDGTTDPYDFVVTPGGKITVVGHRTLPTGNRFPNFAPTFRIAKYLSDGSPDQSFNEDGFLDFNPVGPADGAGAVTVDSTGRVIVGGHSTGQILFGSWQNPLFTVARFIAEPIQNVGFTGIATKPDGRPIANAIIKLQSDGKTIQVSRTNPFGYFRFQNVLSGENYTISATAKGWDFIDRSVLVDDEITNFSIIGMRP